MKIARLLPLTLLLGACQTAPEALPERVESVARAPFELSHLDAESQTLLSLDLAVRGRLAEPGEGVLRWQASAEGRVIGEGETPFTTDAEGAFSLSLPASFGRDYESLLPFQDKPSVEVVLNASIGEHSASRSRWMRSPLLPQVELLTMQFSRDGSAAYSLSYLINIRNPNPFEVAVSTLSYEALLANQVVQKGELPLGSRLPPSAANSFELPARADKENLGPAYGLLRNATQTEWGFRGTLHARTVHQPFDLSGPLTLSRR